MRVAYIKEFGHIMQHVILIAQLLKTDLHILHSSRFVRIMVKIQTVDFKATYTGVWTSRMWQPVAGWNDKAS